MAGPLYLLSHEVQSALQGVGHLNLPVVIVHFHTSTAAQTTRDGQALPLYLLVDFSLYYKTFVLLQFKVVYESCCQVRSPMNLNILDACVCVCGLACLMKEIDPGRF